MSTADPNESRRRRWYQFSLKSILIVMLVVASYLAGRIPAQRRAQQAEQRARTEADRARQAAEESHMRALRSRQIAETAAARALAAEARLTESTDPLVDDEP